jgi:hypothetical protein
MNINIIVFVVTVWQGPGPLPEEVNNDCDRIGPLAPARIVIVCWDYQPCWVSIGNYKLLP